MDVITKSAAETKSSGKKIAIDLVKKKRKSALVLALVGDLGSGKTTFAKGFAEGLGVKARITSPTFILNRNYKLRIKNYAMLYHYDLYRLEKDTGRELTNIGFDEVVMDPENVVLVEWADRAKRSFPKDAVWVSFEVINEYKRKIVI